MGRTFAYQGPPKIAFADQFLCEIHRLLLRYVLRVCRFITVALERVVEGIFAYKQSGAAVAFNLHKETPFLKLLTVLHETLKVLHYRSATDVVISRLPDLGCPYGDFEIRQRPAGI